MASPLNADKSALRKKHAAYMRAYNRARGAKPVLGETFVCKRCGQIANLEQHNQKWCSGCRRDARADFHVKKRAGKGTVSVGSLLSCKNCGISFTKKFKRHFYCESCAKLSEASMLPHQIEATRKRYATYSRERRRNDPKWNIHSRMSAGIKNSLRDGKNGRSWEALLGYTVTELMRHLERQFLSGMSWGNRSEWHIDHIRPLASFSFEAVDDPDFKAAWALTNLRPLWGADNIRKGAKLDYLV